jgi:hypothetical protein
LWWGKPPQPQENSKKIAQTDIKLQRQPTFKTLKTHADSNCNQLPIATASATEPKMQLENNSDKVGCSRPS